MRIWILTAALLISPALLPGPAAAQKPCPKCGRIHTPIPDPVPDQVNPVDKSVAGAAAPYVVARDARAYRHALREAWIMARRGYSNHPLGVAPGCGRSGTGSSPWPKPAHCYKDLPDSLLVARAVVYHNGRYWWSAHYSGSGSSIASSRGRSRWRLFRR